MCRRSDNQKAKRSYALRKANFATACPIIGERVLGMLVERGHLRGDHHPTELEVDEALTAFLFDISGEDKFLRVRTIMRSKWHPSENPKEYPE